MPMPIPDEKLPAKPTTPRRPGKIPPVPETTEPRRPPDERPWNPDDPEIREPSPRKKH